MQRSMKRMVLFLTLTCAVLLAQGCNPARRAVEVVATAIPITAQVEEHPLAEPAECAPNFAARSLLFATGQRLREIRTYDSNGAGLAVGDLDGDRLLDIVFASIDGPSVILWNEGALNFREETLQEATLTRAVTLVDVDGDGRLDIVFTHRSIGGVSYWRNLGPNPDPSAPRFARTELPGVDQTAYALAWGDLNGDGRLDLVTGSYEVELRMRGLTDQEVAARGGVVLYEQIAGGFRARKLSTRAETLSIALLDIDGDGQSDIWAANDFALRDGFWANRSGRWEELDIFRTTSHSTMSIEWADINNDGRAEIFTTDMNPGDLSPEVLAKWLPVIKALEEKHGPSDPQIMANVLQVPVGSGRWRDEAPRSGIDATGWSWSAKFGDLDNDGLLDLYIVNGMIAANLFAHLEHNELVEVNRAYRNNGRGVFNPADDWGLGSTASGRGMVMADMNNDGRLDVVVSNLRSQAQLFENRLCQGQGLEVELRWPDSKNSHALGARLVLRTTTGMMTREVRSTSGYLSGEPPRAHFGLPEGSEILSLDIYYPDGRMTTVTPKPQTLLEVTR